MKASSSTGDATENSTREPRCSDCWAHGDPMNNGPRQTDVLVERIME